jgi:hypothetical protein
MPFAESTYYKIYRATAPETQWAEVPSSPAMTQIPITGGAPNHEKTTVRTNVLDGLGMAGQLVQTEQLARMTGQFELTFSDYQWAMAAALRNSYTTVAISAATDIAASTTDDSFNSTTTNFVTEGIKPNTWFKVSGFTASADNGLFRAASVTSTKIVVNAKITTAGVVTLSPNLTTESAGNAIDIDGKYARNAGSPPSYLMETRITDITTPYYETSRGMRVSNMTFRITAGQIITGDLEMMGERCYGSGSSVSSGDTPWSGEPSLVAGVNVGTIIEGGALMSTNCPIEVTFALNPNMRVDRCIMAITPEAIGWGRWMANGSMRTFFEDSSLRQKHIDHTTTSFVMPLYDAAGNVMVFSFPSVKLATNELAPADPDSPLSSPFTWEAQPTGTAITDYMAQVDLLAA